MSDLSGEAGYGGVLYGLTSSFFLFFSFLFFSQIVLLCCFEFNLLNLFNLLDEIRLWAPEDDDEDPIGYLIFVRDGWGGELSTNRETSGSVRIKFFDCIVQPLSISFLFSFFLFLIVWYLDHPLNLKISFPFPRLRNRPIQTRERSPMHWYFLFSSLVPKIQIKCN